MFGGTSSGIDFEVALGTGYVAAIAFLLVLRALAHRLEDLGEHEETLVYIQSPNFFLAGALGCAALIATLLLVLNQTGTLSSISWAGLTSSSFWLLVLTGCAGATWHLFSFLRSLLIIRPGQAMLLRIIYLGQALKLALFLAAMWVLIDRFGDIVQPVIGVSLANPTALLALALALMTVLSLLRARRHLWISISARSEAGQEEAKRQEYFAKDILERGKSQVRSWPPWDPAKQATKRASRRPALPIPTALASAMVATGFLTIFATRLMIPVMADRGLMQAAALSPDTWDILLLIFPAAIAGITAGGLLSAAGFTLLVKIFLGMIVFPLISIARAIKAPGTPGLDCLLYAWGSFITGAALSEALHLTWQVLPPDLLAAAVYAAAAVGLSMIIILLFSVFTREAGN